MKMDHDWFEMKDVRRRRFNDAVWVPLRAVVRLREVGNYGFAGFEEEFFGAGTLAVPLSAMEAASDLGWSDIGIGYQHRPYVEEGSFIPSDVYRPFSGAFEGTHLVLDQQTNQSEPSEWHLHHDLVLGLDLKREGDSWVCPNEGYIQVAKLSRKNDGNPSRLDFRAEFLKDYLRAREAALYITSCRSRKVVVEEGGELPSADPKMSEEGDGDRWEGHIYEIHEGGNPYGQATRVIRTGRTDIDPNVDVPSIGLPSDEDVVTESWTVEPEGRKLLVVQGEFWRQEWVLPSEVSSRVRGDQVPPTVFFITDAEGKRESQETLQAAGRWLWFRPEVMMALAHQRGGGLEWHTRDSGSVWCSPDHPIHFGVNSAGLVNANAKDIALLPEWQQRIWAGYNVGPNEGVSDELLDSQARAKPANTQAPESFLVPGLDLIRQLSQEKLGAPILRQHDRSLEIASRCHRFRAVDAAGLLALAKDLARLVVDAIYITALRAALSMSGEDDLRSLKLLERLLATRLDPERARAVMGPLVGIYELRHADAHLPSSGIDEALALAGVSSESPFVHQGFEILDSCVSSIFIIVDQLRSWDT